jgi:hypothetical protein
MHQTLASGGFPLTGSSVLPLLQPDKSTRS